MHFNEAAKDHPQKAACRHCGDARFYSHEIHAGGGVAVDRLPAGLLTGAKYKLRVCGTCGLTDWFVPAEYLDGVRSFFKPEVHLKP
ncbi:hypothetical protein [Piscinibacter terrae]|uniref:Uncharacterized protein n=1 Tax=Piscinibacter terrae TaxID=2496871 RepID=A0A3N7HSR7_9BURK|nr:hypothetical protein [Albitalea terrae]RQP24296.1 hypothetical protein DZC73_13400 [Albitalea terrae]